MELVALGLGSNKGRSCTILAGAVKCLQEILMDLRTTPIFETAPQGVTDQQPFLNTAVCGFCTLAPPDLLEAVHHIEASFGRDRTKERRWGERTLDIDILLFGRLVLSSQSLEIPHPRLRERAFALVPLLILLPEAVDPRTNEPYAHILRELPDQNVKHFKSGLGN
ncbi:MAG: 2-amino-4-hydroxy-6-hydroxymethyldihydropteridine diphosphokinase [Treponema sp.]|jgi:2-amino-4-hydroxy-6-hydroxymethyldihydropteridine diphosphokinase|nr:2-amino-4-hydroxy-6-hydroxymethyldihydropteridine diphosphokinase [Treponema sp.]